MKGNTMINKLLNIKYPIIQGAMANISDAKFAATVSNNGGLGIIATGGMDLEMAKAAVLECKSLTDKPFGVNIMLLNPYVSEIVDMLVKEKVKVVTTGAGNPGPYIEKLKSVGTIIIPVVPSVALAKRLEQANVDAIIVEGTEAGGHVGEQTTMALLPQICSEVSIPVIAAGGIADSRGLLAALSLGAQGVQVGTVLLSSEECMIHENYKNLVIKAKDRDTIITGKTLNSPVRVYKNKMSKKYIELEKQVASRDELEHLTMGSLKKAVLQGDIDNGSFMMGQIAGLIKEVKPMNQIFEEMIYGSKLQYKKMDQKIQGLINEECSN